MKKQHPFFYSFVRFIRLRGGIFVIFFFGLFICFSCVEEEQPEKKMSQKQMEEYLIEQNIKAKETEKNKIDYYLKKNELEMEETGTGLRYLLLEAGEGDSTSQGMIATVHYNISLLSGTTCYETPKKKPKKIVIGHDNVESGLHEALLMMREGDKMKLILPSHLGHGLVGDMDCIPMKAVLVCDVELLEVEEM